MTSDSALPRLPLFPLNTVLFPRCQLPLQIFEQRYIHLVRECTRDNSSFVIVLIKQGSEIGDAPALYSIGTRVEITDWTTLDNGLLGITVTARHRVRLGQPSARDDGLLTGAVEVLAETAPDSSLLQQYSELADTLEQLVSHPFADHFNVEVDYGDSTDVCNKLSYLLPISSLDKQVLLEIDDCAEHCSRLRLILQQLQNRG